MPTTTLTPRERARRWQLPALEARLDQREGCYREAERPVTLTDPEQEAVLDELLDETGALREPSWLPSR